MPTTHFEWRDEYSVNVKLIDQQHKKLIKTIDDLYQSILANKAKKEISEIFRQLNMYSNYHFFTEEKYFKEFNYEGTDSHMAIHKKFKKDVAEMEYRLKDEDFNAFELLSFLQDWWVNHILNVDKKYSKNFNQHGLNNH